MMMVMMSSHDGWLDQEQQQQQQQQQQLTLASENYLSVSVNIFISQPYS